MVDHFRVLVGGLLARLRIVHDPYVDAAVERILESLGQFQIKEFVNRDMQGLPLLSRRDKRQERLLQTA